MGHKPPGRIDKARQPKEGGLLAPAAFAALPELLIAEIARLANADELAIWAPTVA